MDELAHKQLLLDQAVAMGATHLLWLDCDEVLDRAGTLGGLRDLCRHWPADLDAYSFREVNLWRGETWARRDTLFEQARFVRLWRVVPGMAFDVRRGVHLRLYPRNISKIKEAPYRVIHYGFCDYVRMMEKIGAHRFDAIELQRCAEQNWILDERQCDCYLVPEDWYPPGCKPLRDWPQPEPRAIAELRPYSELWADEPLVDATGLRRWHSAHGDAYHGTRESVHERNSRAWTEGEVDTTERQSLFRFDPAGKTVLDIGAGGGWFMLDCLRADALAVTGLEVDKRLIAIAEESFSALGIECERYRFVEIPADGPPSLSRFDIIYCMAVFQHLSYQIARAWLRWIAVHLAPGGRAHLQYHRATPDGMTTFMDNEQSVATVALEQDMADAGLEIIKTRLAEGEGVLPVWWLYTVRRADDEP